MRAVTLPCVASLRRHPVIGILLAGMAAFVLWRGAADGRGLKAAVYLATVLVGAVAVDLLAPGARPRPEISVRRPRREAVIAVAFSLVGLGALWLRFLGPVPWQEMSVVTRLLITVPMLLGAFPVGLAAWLVLVEKYRKAADLGLLPRGLLVAPLLVALTAGAAALVDPEGITLGRALEGSGGWLQLLATGLVSAGLTEELSRFVLQTRVGAALRHPAAGWILASLLWGAMHVPVFSRPPDGVLLDGAAAALRIVPIGLLWGCLTHRAGSMLPAILVHGFNLWGLQNG